jgi:hypothetical protein
MKTLRLQICHLYCYPGQERLFLKEKMAWNIPKWGECGERIALQKKGLTVNQLTT